MARGRLVFLAPLIRHVARGIFVVIDLIAVDEDDTTALRKFINKALQRFLVAKDCRRTLRLQVCGDLGFESSFASLRVLLAESEQDIKRFTDGRDSLGVLGHGYDDKSWGHPEIRLFTLPRVSDGK